MKSRAESLRSIAGQSFDVCVIGGGATGSGCALDSQLRGFRTVQLEAGDYASATSSTSRKMATAACVTSKRPSAASIPRNTRCSSAR